MRKIMIIRHAEKPDEHGFDRGVTIGGAHSNHELSVRGWLRAGALVRFFAPHGDAWPNTAIATPRSIFAAAATEDSPSWRSQRTVAPLASTLGIAVAAAFAEGEEQALAHAVRHAPSPVLIAWHHKRIPQIVHHLTEAALLPSASWPDDCFDLVWVLDQAEAGDAWRFTAAAQRLFGHDRTHPL